MLIAGILVFLFGGDTSVFEAAADRVEEHVTDSQRVEQLRSLIDEAESITKQVEKQAEKTGSEFAALNADHGATTDQHVAAWQRARAEYEDATRRLVDLRLEMRELLTREEWRAVFERQ